MSDHGTLSLSYPTASAMLTALLTNPVVAAAVAAYDFGRPWTPGDTVGATVDGLRAAGLIHKALQVATLAAQVAAWQMAFSAGAQSTATPDAATTRAVRHHLHQIVPPRPRGAEPTPHLAGVLAQAERMGWRDGKWVG